MCDTCDNIAYCRNGPGSFPRSPLVANRIVTRNDGSPSVSNCSKYGGNWSNLRRACIRVERLRPSVRICRTTFQRRTKRLARCDVPKCVGYRFHFAFSMRTDKSFAELFGHPSSNFDQKIFSVRGSVGRRGLQRNRGAVGTQAGSRVMHIQLPPNFGAWRWSRDW